MNQEAAVRYSPEQGLFDLTLLNAEIKTATFEDVVIDGIQRGIPPELLTRLKQLWKTTKAIAGEVVAIGKIIVKQIFTFLQENPKLMIGIAVGAAISVLIAAIPFIGPILAPIALLVSTLYGAAMGAAMQEGDDSGSLYRAAIHLATKFFDLIKNIFNAIAQYWVQ